MSHPIYLFRNQGEKYQQKTSLIRLLILLYTASKQEIYPFIIFLYSIRNRSHMSKKEKQRRWFNRITFRYGNCISIAFAMQRFIRLFNNHCTMTCGVAAAAAARYDKIIWNSWNCWAWLLFQRFNMTNLWTLKKQNETKFDDDEDFVCSKINQFIPKDEIYCRFSLIWMMSDDVDWQIRNSHLDWFVYMHLSILNVVRWKRKFAAWQVQMISCWVQWQNRIALEEKSTYSSSLSYSNCLSFISVFTRTEYTCIYGFSRWPAILTY